MTLSRDRGVFRYSIVIFLHFLLFGLASFHAMICFSLHIFSPSETDTLFAHRPGWTFTGMTARPSIPTSTGSANGDSESVTLTVPTPEKPAGAWSARETVLYMLDKVRAGDFYIICPDNETRREVDALRILWAAGDVAEGRPALSRWHPDYKCLFEEYVKDGLAGMQ